PGGARDRPACPTRRSSGLSGRYLMSELTAIGGTRPLMRGLLERGLLHGDCRTVTGKTVAENLADAPSYPEGQEIVYSFDKPIKRSEEHTSELQSRENLVCR